MKYTLWYFDARGRGEQIRLLLTHLGLPFTDKALDGPGWREIKAKSPLGQLPFLVEHGQNGDLEIPQSLAIMRHLARKHGAYGSTPHEMLAADIAADTVNDLRNAFASIRYNASWNDEAVKQKYIKETAPVHLQRMSKLLGKRAFFAADAPTFADFIAYDALDTHVGVWPGCLAEFPQLAEFVARVRALPTLASYLKTQRPPS